MDPCNPYRSNITSDKVALGCKLIPLLSRFLATTALISSSKPLQQHFLLVCQNLKQTYPGFEESKEGNLTTVLARNYIIEIK